MARTSTLIFLCLMFVNSACAQQQESSFPNFWGEFRSAILSGNKERVASLTQFPFEVKGPDDSDPVMRYDRTAFLKIYERLLEQQVYVFAGPQVVSKSMRQMIESKTQISSRDVPSEDFARIEQFTFAKVKGGWWFTRAYVDDPSMMDDSLQPRR